MARNGADMVDLVDDDDDDDDDGGGSGGSGGEDADVVVVEEKEARGPSAKRRRRETAGAGERGQAKKRRERPTPTPTTETLDALLAAQLAAEEEQAGAGSTAQGHGGLTERSGQLYFAADPRWAAADNLRRRYEVGATSGKQEILLCDARRLCLMRQTEKWSCGYGSMQMVLGASAELMPEIRKTLVMGFSGQVPDLHSIQAAVTDAWSRGFDPKGAKDFEGSLLGKAEWIGTTEIASALRASGIPCSIHTFEGHEAGTGVLRFALRALSSSSSSSSSSSTSEAGEASPPLYLQWQGHSCVIVGVERDRSTGRPVALMVLDPGWQKTPDQAQWRRCARRTERWLLRKQKYEIVRVHDPARKTLAPAGSLSTILGASTAWKT